MSVFTPRSLDVDVVLDLMIHDLDIVLGLARARRKRFARRAFPSFTESGYRQRATGFPDGCIANLTASRVSTERVRKLRVFQPRQYISLDYSRQEAAVAEAGAERQIGFHMLPVERSEPLRREVESFLRCVETRERPVVTGEDGGRALGLALAIQDKIEQHLPGSRNRWPHGSTKRPGDKCAISKRNLREPGMLLNSLQFLFQQLLLVQVGIIAAGSSSSLCVPLPFVRASSAQCDRHCSQSNAVEIKIVVLPRIKPASSVEMRSSVTVSTLASALSRIRIGGLRKIARAIAVRCFCPPESVIPRSPTIVARPSGNPSISGPSPAISAARRNSASLASFTPNAIFSPSVALNKKVSCGT